MLYFAYVNNRMELWTKKLKVKPYNEITSSICKSRYKAFLFKNNSYGNDSRR